MNSSMKSAAPRVYLAGEMGNWRHELIGRPENHPELPAVSGLPWGHVLVLDIAEADVVFFWIYGDELSKTSYEIGLAEGLKKPIFIAVSSPVWENFIHRLHPLLKHKHRSENAAVFFPDVRSAYESLMADLDILQPTAFRLQLPLQEGLCLGCGSRYTAHKSVRAAPHHGAYHLDCFERMQNPQEANAAIFNSALVEALRQDNARLEERLRGK